MGAADDDQGAPKAADKRYDWLAERVCSFLKVKEDSWQRLLSSDARAHIASFLDESSTSRLLVYQDGKDLGAAVKPGAKAKKQTVYFVKSNKQDITIDNLNSEVLWGDFGDAPLDALAQVSMAVMLPLFSNPAVRAAWPDNVAQDLTTQLHKFLSVVQVTVGHSKGETVLPLPAEAQLGACVSDKDHVRFLEAALVTWSQQIKEVLKADPSAGLLEAGEDTGPLAEIDAWQERAKRLNGIHAQLGSPDIVRVGKVLEAAQSTYFSAFTRLLTEVKAAQEEANENATLLKPMRKLFERLRDLDDFTVIPTLFRPVMHLLLLVWTHGRHYNTATRFVTLMRLICNDVMQQARRFAPGPELLQMEPADALDRLRQMSKLIETFKAQYAAYARKSLTISPQHPWRFQQGALFGRLDAFEERCRCMSDAKKAAQQFGALERVEIGGTKGKALTATVRGIHAEFAAAADVLQKATYDPLDMTVAQFDVDHARFCEVTAELERRLSAIITQGVEDCATVAAVFKLLDSFEGLLERPAIAAQLEVKLTNLLRSFLIDLQEVEGAFSMDKHSPRLSKNAAPHSGRIMWARCLLERINGPMEKLRGLGAVISGGEEGREVEAQFTRLSKDIADYQAATMEDWCATVGEVSEQKLKLPLLTQEEGGQRLLKVNFDPALVRVLREVHYFLLLPDLPQQVPAPALKMYERAVVLRQQVGSLELIAGLYNGIQRTMVPVEQPLLEPRMAAVQAALTKGLLVMSWNAHRIDEAITEVHMLLKDANQVLAVLKQNEAQSRTTIANWAAPQPFDRKEGKVYNQAELQAAFTEGLTARSQLIADGGTKIGALLAESQTTVKTARASPEWRAYTEFIAAAVTEGLAAAAVAGLRFIQNQVDAEVLAKTEALPLLEVELRLMVHDLVWVPDLLAPAPAIQLPAAADAEDGEPRPTALAAKASSTGQGLAAMWASWIQALLSASSRVARLDAAEGANETYEEATFSNPGVQEAVAVLSACLRSSEAKAVLFQGPFQRFSNLWTSDLPAALQEFLEREGAVRADGSREEPALSKFEAEIAKHKATQEEVQALPSTITAGYIRVDGRPAKQALSTWISKWVYLYTSYLQTKVVATLENLFKFVAAGSTTLDISIDNGPADPEAEEGVPAKNKALYTVMTCMRDVRKTADTTDNCFEPLKDTVGLLAKYNITINDSVLKQLEDGPLAWKGLKKKMFQKREQLAGLQQKEAVDIRRRSDAFAEKVEGFGKFFQRRAPFNLANPPLTLAHVQPAFQDMDQFLTGSVDGYPSLASLDAEGAGLRESQDLFELYVSDYVTLARCREDLKHLRTLWDMVAVIMGKFDEWQSTLWNDIDVDVLIEATKQLAKDVRTLNKAVRAFEVYKLLENNIKGMLTTLPLVLDLHHPAMRERHWLQLMKATGKQFEMGPNFNLGDLLKLELHNAVEVCREIVDRAQKELTIEKALNKIDGVWADLALTFTPFQDSKIMSVVIDEAVTEALETDNLALQNMSGSKYVQANADFQGRVGAWQRKLGAVDTVLASWADVQRKWQGLQSIFIGSADIREQLPEDSKRFAGLNDNFEDLMEHAPEVANVVEACLVEGRQERLDSLLAGLELCEKALQDYLETKRVAFPRFYFVAPADLLDILAKGSNPQAIIRHLPKNFDNVHNLEFRKDADGNPTKTAIGMYSGEGEYVAFASDCVCDGPVEIWLNRVVDCMRAAIAAEFKAAIPTYDERPRTKWIFDYSCQNTIVVSRLYFTAAVDEAFNDMEEGNENALKVEYERQVAQLVELIQVINTDVPKNDRKKLITLCTIDVHARDVVQRLIDERVDSGSAFQWQSQLRYCTNDKTKLCQVNVCDAEIPYGNEYIGNCGCLCITPLTDRCYITLTQAQRLVLGGAPAGPAGTGKTETTKDLARNLGVQCYVFNCSDQLDFRAMGQIYKGLAQTGAWGCFDEFNRIPVAVLSVCSTQYKTVLDALRARKDRFIFEGNDIALRNSVMAFITMNPGYPGRAELPESLKALFRPVSMCIPDLALICEIMLMAEGFQASKMLSRKFVILYKLCEDLLSKSQHYDWKLRAIKTTLYVAGGMKRSAPELNEEQVLLRALRDFNLGKLTADDTGIFLGLLNDLFPKTAEQVPRAIDHAFEPKIREAAEELGYQADEMFCLKISQLREIFVVRWSVFLLGPAGCGKTAIWKTLLRAQQIFGEKSSFKPINPKAVTRNELYGSLHPATREWREGLMSVTYRDMANNKTQKHQWIVLDGDIDAEWIESMNTVMDDNKMLTLASNERIPLAPSMRLLLEINHMKHCSPATVSRGGVIFVNAADIGWRPAVNSWIAKLEVAELRPTLSTFFDRYVETTIEHCRRNFKTVVPLPAISQALTVCRLLEAVLPTEQVRGSPTPDKRLLEAHFVFACVWAFGGTMLVDKVADYRALFSRWWTMEYKAITFPDKGLVYDYYVDEATATMVPWADRVPKFSYMPGSFATLFVPTVESTRLTYFLDQLVSRRHYVMFVGNTGTGKTALMRSKLAAMNPEQMCFSTINLSSFSDAPAVQTILEQPLEKKSGVRYGPPGLKHMVYFVDDMNMPFVDKYDTQSAIELMRQSVDYHGWFDKVKIVLKEVTNVQYCACMNPTAGSFNITPRMQRHFVTFAVQMPSAEIVRSIYASILEGHLGFGNFEPAVRNLAGRLVDATLELHKNVSNTFLPSAVTFHYQFNLRELSSITQGLCRCVKDQLKDPVSIVRLWSHECERVMADRLISLPDLTKFNSLRVNASKKFFEEVPQAEVEAAPNLWGNFMQMSGEDVPLYAAVGGYDALRPVLTTKLGEYNESNAAMELVLFQQAMEHVTRIARTISVPRGNAMLVGVGGSGKQSLARLAAFICNYEVFQITVRSGYGVVDFKADLLTLYRRAGKGNQVVFILTDNQIIDERFLVYVNDLLSTGYIADLCTPEEKEGFCNDVRPALKTAGILDSTENCWDYFIEQVRTYLHVVLCFSPVGERFRVRARQFPALVNCTTMDWFHTWTSEALVSVASRFLETLPECDVDTRENIAYHMAFAHEEVAAASKRYLETAGRYNYTTPKSYLELIALYKDLLARKREQLRADKMRLENGVEKIAQASAQVADLQVNLKAEVEIVEEKKARTGALIESIGLEKATVDEAVESSRADEEDAAKLQAEVTAFQVECSKELEAAEPIIAQAEAALNSLDKASLGELKSFGSPAAEVVMVVSAVLVLTAPGGKIPKDLSWNAGKKSMGNVDQFLKSLVTFDKDNVPLVCVEKVEKDYLSSPSFKPEIIRSKSGAAAGLCGWVVNICKYFRIYQVVAPKRAALAEANKRLEGANKKLTGIRAHVAELRERVALLEASLMKATEDKNTAVAQAERTAAKAKLADRLINGLSSEFARWTATIEQFAVAEGKLVGDALLAAAFVSYAGPFTIPFRQGLVTERWLPDLVQRKIPMTPGLKPLDLLTTDALKAKWANEGLQTDTLSIENGAVLNSASRWPLLIDPQLQGWRWITQKEGPNGLVIIQQSQPKYIDQVVKCIQDGLPLLIENLPEEIDAVLMPVVGKQIIKKGQRLILKLGDLEVDYDPRFRLYLQTKLANPHYPPEIAAQTTLVNFGVTEAGLEEQLLALVVAHERPDLQEQAATLVRQLASYTITLTELEDNLLRRLAASQGDILEDIALIENLEETKRTSVEIAAQVKAAKDTEVRLSAAREVYRPVAANGALLYFLINNLHELDRVYHFSMANFVAILGKGMDLTPVPVKEEKEDGPPADPNAQESAADAEALLGRRVALLVDTTSATVFSYICQGLFVRHQLMFAAQLCMMVLQKKDALPGPKLEFLLRGPRKASCPANPVPEWLPNSCWAILQCLQELDEYRSLPDDLVSSAKRWMEWMALERPEDEPLPGDWKRLPMLDRLLIIRTLRPDRLTAAMSRFVSTTLGKHYVTATPFDLERSFQDARPGTPIFVFLSPGVDVAASVEAMGHKLGFTTENGRYASVSLGQGQEPIAEQRLSDFHKRGGWLLLQNIHLTIDWTTTILDARVDKLSEGAHPEFRLFLSAETPPQLERPLPISLLQNSIKLTNEPPEGLKANLLRAYGNYSEELLEGCAKQGEFRSIVFALSYFHAAMLERKKFGVGNLPASSSGIGWNMNYPFSTGDLLCAGQTASTYLDNNTKVPWEDLRYLFGEILYGGHIVEDWDRRLSSAYLNKHFTENLLEGPEMFPGFTTPPSNANHKMTMAYIEEAMPPETPVAFGLHPNAEIGFKLREGDRFCTQLQALQPRQEGAQGGQTPEERAKAVLDDLLERIPELFDLEDIRSRIDELTPYIMVAIQEAERMNALMTAMRRSLVELNLGLKGDLTMTEPMEKLTKALSSDQVPAQWTVLAYPSLRPLSSWFVNLLQRTQQLVEWTTDLSVPKSVWLSGLFNPQSFLTAVMQTTARRNGWPLDKTVIVTEVTKRTPEQVEAPARDGAYVHGLTLEGARWDEKTNGLEESRPKELFCSLPVMLIRAVPADKAEVKDCYQCPVYTTEARFRQEVFTAQLKSKQSWIRWTLAGVALFLDVV